MVLVAHPFPHLCQHRSCMFHGRSLLPLWWIFDGASLLPVFRRLHSCDALVRAGMSFTTWYHEKRVLQLKRSAPLCSISGALPTNAQCFLSFTTWHWDHNANYSHCGCLHDVQSFQYFVNRPPHAGFNMLLAGVIAPACSLHGHATPLVADCVLPCLHVRRRCMCSLIDVQYRL